MNMNKTKVLSNDNTTIKVGNQIVEKVTETVCLGELITFQNGTVKEVNRRIYENN